jgi:sulfatase maturation enzyme AslB (radical SAM superfamily)
MDKMLTLVLTSDCNLRCAYCYQNAKKPGRMDWETLRLALDQGFLQAPARTGVYFTGGEPIIEFAWIEQAVRYIKNKVPSNQLARFSLSTNGTLLTDEIIQFLDQHSVEIQISFDGVVEAQDMRGLGTFNVIDTWLDRLRNEHADFYQRCVTISMTVMPANLFHLPEAVDNLFTKDSSMIALTPVIDSDQHWDARRIDELDTALERIFDASLKHWQRTSQVPVLLFRNGPRDDSCQWRAREMCGILEGGALTIDLEGQVYGCCVFAGSYQEFHSPLQRAAQESVRIGSIHDPDFAEHLAAFPEKARRTGLFDRKEDKYSAYGKCRDCEFFDQCTICPASTVHRPDNEDPNRVSDFCCAFNRVALKYRARFPKQPGPRDLIRGTREMKANMERWRALAEAARSSAGQPTDVRPAGTD